MGAKKTAGSSGDVKSLNGYNGHEAESRNEDGEEAALNHGQNCSFKIQGQWLWVQSQWWQSKKKTYGIKNRCVK